MKPFAFLFCILAVGAGCVVESKPIDPSNDGGIDSGVLCGAIRCPEDRPLCNDALECVQCTTDDDSYCTDQGLLCDVESSSCVGCTGDSDCTDPAAARCDNDVCTSCNEASQCDGVDGLDPTDNVCEEGLCVDCTPETEGDSCTGDRSCNPATNECTEVFIGSLDVCEACVADSQCGDDGEASDAFRCVPMFYDMPDARFPDDATGFCLKEFSPGGCEQPYAIETPVRESLSASAPATYCGINEALATCPAVRALDQNQGCPSGEDTACPESGICRAVGGLADTCTFRCASVFECLENDPEGTPGSTCDSSGTGGAGGAPEDYCGG